MRFKYWTSINDQVGPEISESETGESNWGRVQLDAYINSSRRTPAAETSRNQKSHKMAYWLSGNLF